MHVQNTDKNTSQARTDKELSFQKGESILVLGEVGTEWFEGVNAEGQRFEKEQKKKKKKKKKRKKNVFEKKKKKRIQKDTSSPDTDAFLFIVAFFQLLSS
jgi:hypothetical protein